jgi:hypothetical protein
VILSCLSARVPPWISFPRIATDDELRKSSAAASVTDRHGPAAWHIQMARGVADSYRRVLDAERADVIPTRAPEASARDLGISGRYRRLLQKAVMRRDEVQTWLA